MQATQDRTFPAETAGQITATEIPGGHWRKALPKDIGPGLTIQMEMTVYAWMTRLSPGYAGGTWTLLKLSNGGVYLRLVDVERVRIVVVTNGFDGEVSADAAGIIVTLFGLNYLCNTGYVEQFDDLYYGLRDYALAHAEAALIVQAID
jgi:hypothetical protein